MSRHQACASEPQKFAVSSLPQSTPSLELSLSMEFLPNELLRAIFCEVTAAPKSTLNTNRIYEFEAPWSLTRAPYELAAVSRLWRGICMSTPELWTYIQLIGDDQHRNIDLLRQNLDRSGSRPLDVCFSLGFIDHNDWRTAVEIVLEHAHRWRRLMFSMARCNHPRHYQALHEQTHANTGRAHHGGGRA